jgi:hypothetical protein
MYLCFSVFEEHLALWKHNSCSLCILVDLHVVANNINHWTYAMEMQEWVPLALLLSNRVFCTAVNSINALRFSSKMPDTVA